MLDPGKAEEIAKEIVKRVCPGQKPKRKDVTWLTDYLKKLIDKPNFPPHS